MNRLSVNWANVVQIGNKTFQCSFCGENISSNLGYQGNSSHGINIYICHMCNRPIFFENHTTQYPGVTYGADVKLIPMQEVEDLYNEARECISVNAYTASILCSRKLLMNIAVSLKAKAGLTFIEYVDFLSDSGYIPPNGKGWVDYIRKKGNETTHIIKLATEKDAKQLIDFLYMLMKFIYEFPGLIPANNDKLNS